VSISGVASGGEYLGMADSKGLSEGMRQKGAGGGMRACVACGYPLSTLEYPRVPLSTLGYPSSTPKYPRVPLSTLEYCAVPLAAGAHPIVPPRPPCCAPSVACAQVRPALKAKRALPLAMNTPRRLPSAGVSPTPPRAHPYVPAHTRAQSPSHAHACSHGVLPRRLLRARARVLT
jgi:hypothetical protein